MAERKTQGDSDRLLAQLLDSHRTRPGITGLWGHVQSMFGGPEGFAKEAKACYEAAKPGSPTRARMMSMFLELHNKAAAEDLRSNPATELSMQDMEAVVKMLVGEDVAGQHNAKPGDDSKDAKASN